MENQIIQLLFYCVPAAITGVVAFYFFGKHTENEEGRRRYLLHREAQKDALPVRLQAYERMTLFLERITPSNLIVNTAPIGNSKNDYEAMIIQQIETEYNHNIAQQIYMTEECWSIIKAAKNTTIQIIRKVAMSSKIDTADKLREAVLNEFMEKQAPSITAISYIKNEVSQIIG